MTPAELTTLRALVSERKPCSAEAGQPICADCRQPVEPRDFDDGWNDGDICAQCTVLQLAALRAAVPKLLDALTQLETPGGDGRQSEGGEHAPAVRLEAERGVSPSGLRPPMTAVEREQFLVDNLAKQLVESRNLARWALDFLPAGSPGRLAAEEVMNEWGEQWSTAKPEAAT